MSSRAIIFSGIALLGAVGLLWVGYTGIDSDLDDGHEHGEYYEHASETYRGDEHEQARHLQQQGDILPLESILLSARRHHDGRVLETELKQRDGRYVYKVELLDRQGHVWEMTLDARSGELIGEEQED